MRTSELNSCIHFDRDDGLVSLYVKKSQRAFIVNREDFNAMLELATQDVTLLRNEVELALYAQAEQIGLLPNEKPTSLPYGFRIYDCDRFFGNTSFLRFARSVISFSGLPIFLIAVIWSKTSIITSTPFTPPPFYILFVLFVLASVLSIIAHEIAHGLIGRYFGAHVPETGIQLAAGKPLCYTRVIGLSKENRIKKAEYYAAGINAHFFLAGITLLVMITISNNSLLLCFSLVNNIFMLANTIAIAPFTDGFKIANTLAVNQKTKSLSTIKLVFFMLALSVLAVLLFTLHLTSWLSIAL